MKISILTGLLLIIVPMAFNITFFFLQKAFEYPDILRRPTETILQRFKQGGAPLRRLWYAFSFSAVLFYPGSGFGAAGFRFKRALVSVNWHLNGRPSGRGSISRAHPLAFSRSGPG